MATTTTASLSQVVRTAFDRLLYFDLRSQPTFDMVADVKPALQAMPGNVVTWTILSNLAAATSTLTETSDISPVTLATTQVSATLNEYGNGVELSAFLRAVGLVDVDEGTLNVLGYNMADSLDQVAVAQLQAGTNVRFAQGAASRAAITPSNTIQANDVRIAVTTLRGNKAVPKKQGYYIAFIHPNVSYDLRAQTSSAANASWREAHIYASPEAIYAGEIGAFEGAAFVETPRAPIFLNAGSSPTTTNVYATIVVAQQALAKAVAIDPHLVQSPVVDRLRRLVNYGWYSLLGYVRFREAAIIRIESATGFPGG
jgi:N4-gp56 family major capsid protein